MKDKPADAERLSLSRWSRRKLEASAAERAPARSAPPPAAPVAPVASVTSVTSTPTELPSIDSLSLDSDFTAFLRPEVDEKLKRAALKQLFRDPRFNVMDGLDTYIDDYTKADPISPDVLQGLLQRGFGALSSPAAQEVSAEGGRATPATPSLPAADTSPAATASAKVETAPETAPEERKPGSSS